MELQTNTARVSSPAPIAYLAGPHFDDAADWRLEASNALTSRGIEALERARVERASAAQDTEREQFNDVKRCDALLINLLNAKTLALAAVKALAWAYVLRKPAVVVIERTGNPHDLHPMIAAAMPFRVHTLEDAIDSVAIITKGGC